jgi:hypothetical protein
MEDPPADPELTRAPYLRDLIEICRGLNAAGARYVVMGGMAVNAHGNIRATEDIDLLIETTEENERKVLEVLALLPDGVAKEIKPGEVSDYVVVRICDEFTIDLMAKACGIDYGQAKDEVTLVTLDGVPVPYASPRLLWKTKQTFREKDQIDRIFLRKLLEDRGEWPVE